MPTGGRAAEPGTAGVGPAGRGAVGTAGGGIRGAVAGRVVLIDHAAGSGIAAGPAVGAPVDGDGIRRVLDDGAAAVGTEPAGSGVVGATIDVTDGVAAYTCATSRSATVLAVTANRVS